jgi:O-antigen ligase
MPARSEQASSRPRIVSAHLAGFPVVLGGLLCLMLVYTTCTVFIQSAWALQTFQLGIYLLVAAYLLINLRREKPAMARGAAPWLVYLIPAWGVLQIMTHTTTSTFHTREAVLRWGSLAGVFFLSQVVAQSAAARHKMLTIFLGFATTLAALCILQIFTSDGSVLWLFPTGYPDVYGTFPNANNFAQFIELALPIALSRVLHSGTKSWGYALCGGLLFASVVASASRAGTLLCAAELLVFLGIGVARLRNQKPALRSNPSGIILILVPVLALVLSLAVGWQHVVTRLEAKDPFTGRREFLISALDMAKHRPLTGFGLDTFPDVYPQFAIFDFPLFVNHAHNDWAEFAADGGIPFFLLILIPCAWAIPTAMRHPWGLGLIFVMLHACVDYPFPRPAVSGWLFYLLALLFMQKLSDTCNTSEDILTQNEETD